MDLQEFEIGSVKQEKNGSPCILHTALLPNLSIQSGLTAANI